jgi:hypothetical protein
LAAAGFIAIRQNNPAARIGYALDGFFLITHRNKDGLAACFVYSGRDEIIRMNHALETFRRRYPCVRLRCANRTYALL